MLKKEACDDVKEIHSFCGISLLLRPRSPSRCPPSWVAHQKFILPCLHQPSSLQIKCRDTNTMGDYRSLPEKPLQESLVEDYSVLVPSHPPSPLDKPWSEYPVDPHESTTPTPVEPTAPRIVLGPTGPPEFLPHGGIIQPTLSYYYPPIVHPYLAIVCLIMGRCFFVPYPRNWDKFAVPPEWVSLRPPGHVLTRLFVGMLWFKLPLLVINWLAAEFGRRDPEPFAPYFTYAQVMKRVLRGWEHGKVTRRDGSSSHPTMSKPVL